jgi:hypothetical protein
MSNGVVFIENTYAGEVLAGYMASTLLGADSIKRNLITVIPNVKKRMVILGVDDDVELLTPSAAFSPSQDTQITQNESYLDPVPYEFRKEINWVELVQSWESEQLKPGALNDYQGVDGFTNWVIDRYLEKLSITNERLYWLGKDNVPEAKFTADYEGLLPKIKANADTVQISLYGDPLGATITDLAFSAMNLTTKRLTVTSNTVLKTGDVITFGDLAADTITDTVYGAVKGQSYFIKVISATVIELTRNYNAINTRVAPSFTGTTTSGHIQFINVSNVMAVMAAIYAQVDFATRIQPDFKVMVPLHVRHAFEIASSQLGINVLGAFTNPVQEKYLGIYLESMNQWLGNTILCARVSNIFLGVDLISDDSMLRTVHMANYTNDDLVRIKARMKSDTNVKFFNEVLLVTPSGDSGS